MKFACTRRKLKFNILWRPFYWSLDLAGILAGIWLARGNWQGFWLESGWPGEIDRDFGWNLADPGNLAGIWAGLWLESGWPGEIGRDFGWNLASPGKLAGISAGIWLARGNRQGFWLESGCLEKIGWDFGCPGENSDFPRKSEFRPKPPRTTNFHLKDPGTSQLEFLTLVTMV